jgi:hypothetical protein
MTPHVHYDHQCPFCKAYYIPYDVDVPCPDCGLVEQERFDFIPQAVASARFNLETHGSYVPTAWFACSLADHILWLLFGLLENQRKEPDGQPFEGLAHKTLEYMNWGTQAYLRDHVYAIAVRVYEKLNMN